MSTSADLPATTTRTDTHPMKTKKLIHLTRETWSRSIGVHLGLRYEDNTLAIARAVTLEKHEEGSILPQEPLFSLDDTEAQNLIDELWHLGVRPTEGHGSTGQLAATEKHLDHTTALLNQTLQTVLNVANASLITQHGLKPAES
jgi:hypothetical protein